MTFRLQAEQRLQVTLLSLVLLAAREWKSERFFRLLGWVLVFCVPMFLIGSHLLDFYWTAFPIRGCCKDEERRGPAGQFFLRVCLARCSHRGVRFRFGLARQRCGTALELGFGVPQRVSRRPWKVIKTPKPPNSARFFAVLKDAPCETSIFENRGCQKHEDSA